MSDTSIETTALVPSAQVTAVIPTTQTTPLPRRSFKKRATLLTIKAVWRLAKVSIVAGIAMESSVVALNAGYASYEYASTHDIKNEVDVYNAYRAGMTDAKNKVAIYSSFDPKYTFASEGGSSVTHNAVQSTLVIVRSVSGYGLKLLNLAETALVTAPAGAALGAICPGILTPPTPMSQPDDSSATRPDQTSALAGRLIMG